MEHALNPRLDKETIYEIYRACRLCGAGAGYKMPIMQNVIHLEDSEINLSKKIRECVQIEVHADDKMPPLICELCVDKVNDFYEFLELCKQTNKRTRLKLGLPMQTTPKGVDSGDCILGDTAPVYINEDSNETSIKYKSKTRVKEREKERMKEKEKLKTKVKNEPEVKIKVEPLSSDRSRASRRPPAPPSPPPIRVTRTSCGPNDLNGGLQDPQKRARPAPKSIMKKEKEEIKVEDDSSRLKRLREKDVKSEIPVKKVKILLEQCSSKSNKQSSPKTKPKPPAKRPASPPAKHAAAPVKHSGSSTKNAVAPAKHTGSSTRHATAPAKHTAAPAKHPGSSKQNAAPARRPASPATIPAVQYTCKICSLVQKNSQGYQSHLRSHVVTFTRPTMACNACGEWFPTYDEACSHHRMHKHDLVPYKCRRCSGEFKTHHSYEEHFGQSQCIPFDEVPDVKCGDCWRYFATDRLLIEHKCAGEEGRPGGKCVKCNRTYVLLKNLRRHEAACMHRRRSVATADSEMVTTKQVQIRMARCDPLLEKERDGHYDVSGVTDFGFDPNCIYPYKTICIKAEPFDGMVKIQEEVRKEFCSEEYVHWDSTDSEEEVDSLVTLSLKTIFSQKVLGRVPRKRRVKIEEDKTIDVSSDANVSEEGFQGFNLVSELNDVSSRVGDVLDAEKGSINNDSIVKDVTDVTERLDAEKPTADKDCQNGDDFNNDIDDFGNSNLTGNDTNDGFEDIDGSKLIAALNEQIGEDDETEGERSFKDLDKNELGDEKHNKCEINVNEANEKLNNNKEHFNNIEHSDENINDKCGINESKQNEKLNDKETDNFNEHSKEIDKGSEEINSNKDKDLKDLNSLKHDENFENDSNINNTIQNEVKHSDFENACLPKDNKNNENNVSNVNTLEIKNNNSACAAELSENGHENEIENGKCEKLCLEDLLERDLEKNDSLKHISDEDYNFDV
ncbi:uncharacterized protein LOC115454059 isoform X2 [Manduca sexta]|uniref:uncharacterized protein LOC115454059 isoform X2 n=1 Tax=Manduca sexta TaxID=7130 RepID=UPI0011823079|nr:uncharacterized protein LOC115454059 isoform X2 [Manduca sexta]